MDVGGRVCDGRCLWCVVMVVVWWWWWRMTMVGAGMIALDRGGPSGFLGWAGWVSWASWDQVGSESLAVVVVGAWLAWVVR